MTPLSFDFLPNHVTFRGMPDPRWWNFEDAVTDFGALDAEIVDLAKLLVMEFALVYGNDWFSVPVPVTLGVSDVTPRGTLSRVTTLVVTDTFGVRTLIRPSEQTQVNPGESPWSMYKISGDGVRSDFILMAPTLGVTTDAPAIEEVAFLRDDIAAMAWAVENTLQGDLDAPVDAYQMYLQRLAANPPPPPPRATAGAPPIYYTLEQPPPDNWIPMVPVQTPSGGALSAPRRDGERLPGRQPHGARAHPRAGPTVLRCRSLCAKVRRAGEPVFPLHPRFGWNGLPVAGAQVRPGPRRRVVRPALRHRAQRHAGAHITALACEGRPSATGSDGAFWRWERRRGVNRRRKVTLDRRREVNPCL